MAVRPRLPATGLNVPFFSPAGALRSDGAATVQSSAGVAWADWWSGTRTVNLWWTLAWFDTVLRYRRSMLGPL